MRCSTLAAAGALFACCAAAGNAPAGAGDAVAGPISALEVAEVRGDFSFNAQGQIVGFRSVDLPAGKARGPMSFREKFDALGLVLPERRGALAPRWVAPKSVVVQVHEKTPLDKVVVKFVEGMPVRLRGGRLMSAQVSLSEVAAIVARYPEATVHRAFESTEERILDEDKETGEILSGKQLADLNNYYVFLFDHPSQRAVDLANELLRLDVVETAYLPPRDEVSTCTDIGNPTPDYESMQDYLNAAPEGLDARFAWAFDPGGDGFGPTFQIVNLEHDWCTDHEDLNFDASDVLNGQSAFSEPDHGTATLGIYGACDNGYGTTGICSDVDLKACDLDSELTTAAAITVAATALMPGEIITMSLHQIGPSTGLPCPCNCSQFEFIPVEFLQSTFDAIQTATANGIIVCEAAGNGSMSLDNMIYDGAFNRNVRDSGAILVGAAWPSTHEPTCFTDYGTRVDVHGYGEQVTTTGYGSWPFGGACAEDYTGTFSGTSSATPMVAGAAGSLQGVAKSKFGLTIWPGAMRNLLTWTGTSQGASTKHIGPMPDLHAAIDDMSPIGPDLITSYTPAGWSYPVVPRTTADATNGSAPLQASALPGTPAPTYLNIAVANNAWYSPTVHLPRTITYLDDYLLYSGPDGDIAQSAFLAAVNVPSGVKAGRHTLLARADFLGVEPEYDEGNNDWARQFLWAPGALSFDSPLGGTSDPPAFSPGWGPYYNCEGFSGTMGGNWWYAFAVQARPEGGLTEFDLRVHTTPPTNIPQAGFDTDVAWSGAPSGEIDFVVLDKNVLPSGTYYAGILNFWGTAQKVVEFDVDHGTVYDPGTYGPFSLEVSDLIELHEIYLYAGSPMQITVVPVSGTADVGLSLYRPPSGYAVKLDPVAGAYVNAAGGGAGETLLINPPAQGYYGIVVWKVGTADVPKTLAYNLVVAAPAPNLVAATPTNWFGPVVPRNNMDGASNNCPLPPTLSGNSATTSFNFATYNNGGAPATAPWSTAVYADNQGLWYGTQNTTVPINTFSVWNNTLQGGPQSIVRGGRHHIQSLADVFGQLPEALEFDNFFADWFVWTPLDLANQVPALRSAPPPRHPLGWGPYESCDGFRVPGYQGSWWTAIGMIPTSMTDEYDVRLHTASIGSRDGFGAWLAESADPFAGNPDFCIVNYNTAPFSPTDVSVTSVSNSSDNFYIQRADAPYWGFITSLWDSGPLVLDAHDCLDIHEFYFASGVPTYITLRNLSGGVDLETFLFDGTIPYHTKGTYITYDNAHGPGGDEHLGPITLSHSGYYALVVAKSKASDVNNQSTYELVINVGPPVDAPVVESLPTAFTLSAPRPNPSSAGVSVELAVPAGQGKASVVVYDLSGRCVRKLADGESTAGRHLLTWDGRDTSGKRAAAGVYFVRLESDKVRESTKITLLR